MRPAPSHVRARCRRAALAPATALIVALPLSGCVGLMVEKTTDEDINSPQPLNVNRLLHPTADRWACHAGWDATPTAVPLDFLETWGEPQQKVPNGSGETWVYEGREWCGIWVFFGVPVPLLLPVCKAHDRVHFETGVAMRAESHRVVASGFGIAVVPNPFTLLLPMPFAIAPGQPSDGQAYILRGDPDVAPCPSRAGAPAPIPNDRSRTTDGDDELSASASFSY